MLLTIASVIAIIYMLGTVVYTAVSLIFTDIKTQTKRIQNYRKGKFLIHYFAAFPLYIAAYLHTGNLLVWAIFKAVTHTVASAVLAFDVDVLAPTMEDNLLYLIAVTLYVILTVANTLLFSVSVFWRRISNRLMLKSIKTGERDAVVLVGYKTKNRLVLDSMKRYSETDNEFSHTSIDVLVLSDKIDDEFKEEMHVNRAAYLPYDKDTDLEKLLKQVCVSFKNRHVSVVIQTENDEENLKLAFQYADLAESLGADINSAYRDKKTGIDAYVFTEGDSGTVYRRIIKRAHGTVHCLSRYNMLARDFIARYPLTLFTPERIDTENALIKSGTDYRIIMVGFGHVNRQLFRAYTQNNKFLTKKDGKLIEQPLTYHIFDKIKAHEEATLNHTYYHYENWLTALSKEKEKDYFELPPKPAEVYFHERNINELKFYDEFRESLASGDGAFNMIVIALGEDMTALDLAEKLAVYVREENLENRTKIFVRVKNLELNREASEKKANEEIDIIPFGEINSLFNFDRIVNPGAEKIALDRHFCYALESRKKNQTELDVMKAAYDKWLFQWEDIQRESNAFACLAMRTRFHLLGYEIVPKGERSDAEEFLEDYQRGNKIAHTGEVVNKKEIVDYDKPYHVPGTPRTNLAILEHSRWNAYYICSGYIPASKSEYRELGKNALMRKRKHINVTTFDGLSEYAEWRMENEGITLSEADVIRYDYQLMDDAIWMLDRRGYTVVKRTTDTKKDTDE